MLDGTMISAGQGEQAEVIQFLADPATHGGEAVKRIDTHASVVFLAGQLAYKLKRAVRYSYLDYASVEARQRACEAEITLNRRTAPEIYVQATPVCRTAGGGLQLGGKGAAVDWVVAMRRFDDNLLFDRLAQRGALTLDHGLELAAVIADFHRIAEVDRRAGGAAAVADVMRGNLANLSVHIPPIFDTADIEMLRLRSEKAMAEASGLLDRRRAEGHVRLCHGDLHLRNVCLIGGKPVLFDCIEFSRELACIDVLYDLAFLLMDLEERHLRTVANAVFNRYLDLTDESGGILAIPLFLSVRAAVRAHVTATAAKLNSDPQTCQRLATEARQYLQLALELLQPVSPALIAIGGLSGTGKTTLAYNLAPQFGAPPGARVLRTDVLRKRLAGQPLTARLPAAAYGEAMTRRVYDVLAAEAAAMLAGGRGAIVDAVFARESERRAIEKAAARHDVPFMGFWLVAPLTTMEERVERRRNDASDATVEIVRRQQVYDIGKMTWLRIDASGTLTDVAERARAVIRLSPKPH
jgi:aminoglycoside phosphotransferase family enzyme/predicted kinase